MWSDMWETVAYVCVYVCMYVCMYVCVNLQEDMKMYVFYLYKPIIKQNFNWS